MIDRKKRTLEGHFSYRIGYLVMSWFGSKVRIKFKSLVFFLQFHCARMILWLLFVLILQFASMLNYRIVCNTSFTISNLVGPQEEITLAGNPVTYIRANTSSIAHVWAKSLNAFDRTESKFANQTVETDVIILLIDGCLSVCEMQALTMHVVSYAGRADMQILVAKDIIPDPEFLAKCFEDALLEMKEAATAAEVSNKI